MRYILDHDYHIHSFLSSCSNDPTQTTTAILEYAENNNFKKICLTDHFWDSSVPGASMWYKHQDYDHIKQSIPLPQGKITEFSFGCEIDMDKYMTVGISKECYDNFDFVIIPTTHLHMEDLTIDPGIDTVEERAKIYVDRLDALLNMDLPFEKIGIAHLTCGLLYNKNHVGVINAIADETFERLFTRASRIGVGIELNFSSFAYTEEDLLKILRPYVIAKRQKCRFYFGSDAHHPDKLNDARANFEHIVDLLNLTEDDKFSFPARK